MQASRAAIGAKVLRTPPIGSGGIVFNICSPFILNQVGAD
jgi:hypothetical protein